MHPVSFFPMRWTLLQASLRLMVRTGPSRMAPDRGLFEGREEECLCVPCVLERDIPLEANPLFMLIFTNTAGLIQREPGPIQCEFVAMPGKEPIDGRREFLQFVVLFGDVRIDERIPERHF